MRKHILALAMLAVLTATSCEFDGISSVPLPFAAGTEEGSYQITVELPQLGNLVPNAEVKVDDMTVGTVTGIDFDNWHAKLTVSLQRAVQLPANATAKVGQKSLLGAEFLQLAPPPGQSSVGQLRAGDVIPLPNTGRYPETEEVLAALSGLLNGGGLNQIRTISSELNRVLAGRETDTRQLLGNLEHFTGSLDRQREEITAALGALDRFGGELAVGNQRLAKGLDALGPGAAVLNANRPDLTRALSAVSSLGDVTKRIIAESGSSLVTNLREIQPVLGGLADAGKALPESLPAVGTFPFSVNTLGNMFRGDYLNLTVTLDLTVPTLDKNLLSGLPLVPGVPTAIADTLPQLVAPLSTSPPPDQQHAQPSSGLPLPAPLPAPPPPAGGLGSVLDSLVPGGR